MLKINIGNSYSQITGLTTEQFRNLRKILSYTQDPKAAYFSGGFVRTNYLIDKKGSFPTGLLHRAEEFLVKESFSYQKLDNRVVPKPLSHSKLNLQHEPYPDQINAVKAAMKHERGGIVMPTGTGKSLVIALIAHYRRVRTLVIVPTLEIKKQLQETLKTVLGKGHNVTVENIDSSRLGQANGFDCLILDECHHSAASTYRKLNKTKWSSIYYRYFLTATFFRNQEDEQLLFESIAGYPIYNLSYKHAIERGYICGVEGYYINVPKQDTEAYSWRDVYSSLVVHNKSRNEQIAGLLKALDGAPTLCLVKEIAHGNILREMTGIQFVNGQDEESRSLIQDFNTGRIKALIGTTGVLGEGIDTKPAEYIIIAGLGKAKSAFMQQVGRGVRKYPGKESCKVILFRDTSHKFLLRHFKQQAKILREEYGVKCLPLSF